MVRKLFLILIAFAFSSVNAASLDIPLYKQELSHSCGQTAVQMVLGYYDIEKTQKEIAFEMGKFGYSNFGDLLLYFKHQELNAYIVDDFRPYAEAYPVIVLDTDYLHWIVLQGENTKEYLFLDPYEKTIWFKGSNYTKHYKSIVVEG